MSEAHNFLRVDGPSPQHLPQANRPDRQSLASDAPLPTAHARGQLVPWRTGDLRPHPSYARLGITVPASRLNALLEMGEDAFVFPLVVTSDGIVIDGYARLEVARLHGRATVECIEYDISEEEALRRLLLCHRPSSGLPPFSRIVMSRDLAKSLKEKALQHQQAGGKNKGSSKLTEAEKVDVRKEIAATAGVSAGTCSHALQLIRTADREIVRTLCNGEIKIDRAWRWSKEPRSCQRDNLKLYRRHRGMERIVEMLVARQLRKLKLKRPSASKWKNVSSSEVVSLLAALTPDVLKSVDVVFIKSPAPVIALSEDVARHLEFREEASACS